MEETTKQHEGDKALVTETPPPPKEISKKTITIDVTSFDNGTQNMDVKTPTGSTITDNIGVLEFAKQILVKDKF